MTAEGLVGGALGVVYARLRAGDREPLTGLLDELMGMIALQYLGPRAARREQRRPAPAPRPLPQSEQASLGAEKDPLDEVEMRLTYRTARVLACIAERPGASNRAVAERAGVTDPGQISKLLRRLERLGLAVNSRRGPPERRAECVGADAVGYSGRPAPQRPHPRPDRGRAGESAYRRSQERKLMRFASERALKRKGAERAVRERVARLRYYAVNHHKRSTHREGSEKMLRISLRSGFMRGPVSIVASLAIPLVGLLSFGVSASALPAGRAYEMVSPSYKQGYGVTTVRAVEPGGGSVVFSSQGGFSGALSGGVAAHHYYIARRGEKGWSTGSFEPAFGGLSDVSVGLEYGLASGPVGPNAGVEDDSSVEEVFQLHSSGVPDTPESWGVFGDIVMRQIEGQSFDAAEAGASSDLCHVVLSSERALLPEAEGTLVGGGVTTYDLSRGCGGREPYLRLLALNNGDPQTPINPGCPAGLGTGRYLNNPHGIQQDAKMNAVDATGDEIFFTTSAQEEASAGCGGTSGVGQQLFVRVGGSRTVEVSRPLEGRVFGGCVGGGVPGEVPCDGASSRASAYFKGASEDGSKVFFATEAPLTEGAGCGVGCEQPTGSNLYMASIGCPAGGSGCEAAQREVTSLVEVSHDAVAEQAAEVQGVVNIAQDGSRVYFVARGVLSEGADAEGHAPVGGADNLYVYDSVSGQTTFVADLCSGPGRSGVSEDARCPRGLQEGGGDAALLWGERAPEAQSTQDGSFLVFAAYAQLSPGDTDSARDVYRYDALTGRLERVSVGEDDYDANGNNDAFGADIEPAGAWGGNDNVYIDHELATHAISEDGSRIVFSTADPLSPAATNGRVDVYEWDEGSVSLISSGTSEENDGHAMITPSGRDIFFVTSQGLVSGDTDGLPDIYDAHECTAQAPCFVPAAAERAPCEGDACQGPLTNPAPLLVPGSVSQAAGGNFAPPVSAPAVGVKKKANVKKKPKKAQPRKARSKTKDEAKKSNHDRRVKR